MERQDQDHMVRKVLDLEEGKRCGGHPLTTYYQGYYQQRSYIFKYGSRDKPKQTYLVFIDKKSWFQINRTAQPGFSK